jgi:outer membrane protein OmpA-like peptidoglycan-associated protein
VRPIHLVKTGNGVMKYGTSVSTPITFSFEYNFSKPLAAGVKLHYRAYAKDNLEGATYLNWDGVTNDYIGAGTVYLRYKFNSINRDHLRNLTMKEWQPEESLKLIADVKKDLAGLKNRMDTVEKKVKDLVPRVKKLEDMINNIGPDSDNDGVIDLRDLDPNTPTNTAVDFYGKALPVMTVKADKKARPEYIDDIPAVYFDFDRTELDNDALITISKVAARMLKDSSLLVEVRGYCDFLGDVIYNEKLSQRRSDKVKRELVKVWGIAEDRIISNGKGKIIQPQIKYRPNRRCDFFFSNDIVDVLNQ